jgi:hypothetical protein
MRCPVPARGPGERNVATLDHERGVGSDRCTRRRIGNGDDAYSRSLHRSAANPADPLGTGPARGATCPDGVDRCLDHELHPSLHREMRARKREGRQVPLTAGPRLFGDRRARAGRLHLHAGQDVHLAEMTLYCEQSYHRDRSASFQSTGVELIARVCDSPPLTTTTRDP